MAAHIPDLRIQCTCGHLALEHTGRSHMGPCFLCLDCNGYCICPSDSVDDAHEPDNERPSHPTPGDR